MKKYFIVSGFIFAIFVVAGIIFFWTNFRGAGPAIYDPPELRPTKKAEITNLIRVDEPLYGAVIQSPLKIKGEARGFWFFEGSFPIRLLDGNGKEIARTIAQTADWMTENFVPFEANLTFTRPAMPMGILVLEKDNPSGLPEHAQELRVPVLFQ